jgi:DNA processing protein
MPTCPSCESTIPDPRRAVVGHDHPSWPHQLNQLDDTPTQLYTEGNLDLLTEPRIGIIGSRAATMYGTHTAQALSSELVGRGYVIVSGGAFGIDAAAHRGSGGRTIVVLADGLDRLHPVAHREMFSWIVDNGGLLLTEYRLGATVSRASFLNRNRIIAALSQGVVVVESAVRSGSMAMAMQAVRLGRPLMAVPGPVTSMASAGTHLLIRRDGAQLITSSDDVVEFMESQGIKR